MVLHLIILALGRQKMSKSWGFLASSRPTPQDQDLVMDQIVKTWETPPPPHTHTCTHKTTFCLLALFLVYALGPWSSGQWGWQRQSQPGWVGSARVHRRAPGAVAVWFRRLERPVETGSWFIGETYWSGNAPEKSRWFCGWWTARVIWELIIEKNSFFLVWNWICTDKWIALPCS